MNVGQAAIFFLQADPTGGFYRQIGGGLPIDKSDPGFEIHSKGIRALLKVHADPQTALLVEKASDRQFAAVALVARYAASRPWLDSHEQIQEAIPTDQNQLIMGILAEMKWTDPPVDREGTISLPNVFWRLQLTEKAGWMQPQPKVGEDPNALMNQAVTKWFKDHAGTYRVQRLVPRPVSN